MSVPLATLRRHGRLVWLHDALGAPLPLALEQAPGAWTGAAMLDARRGRRRRFDGPWDAGHFLAAWLGDVDALMALRRALQRCDPAAPIHAASDEEIVHALAERLARGSIIVTEGAEPPIPAVLPAAPAPPAVADPPAVPIAQLLGPPPAPPVPLLPILEEVRIEGAEVLPEIEQSLEQVEITIGEINLAPVSLEPTPSKVPAIQDAMSQASASITQALDGL